MHTAVGGGRKCGRQPNTALDLTTSLQGDFTRKHGLKKPPLMGKPLLLVARNHLPVCLGHWEDVEGHTQFSRKAIPFLSPKSGTCNPALTWLVHASLEKSRNGAILRGPPLLGVMPSVDGVRGPQTTRFEVPNVRRERGSARLLRYQTLHMKSVWRMSPGRSCCTSWKKATQIQRWTEGKLPCALCCRNNK